MSKSQVKKCSVIHNATADVLKKTKSDVFCKQIHSTLNSSRKINLRRCQEEPAPISRPCKTKLNKLPNRKDVSICKLLYPPESKYPKCDHASGLVLNRELLLGDEYLNYLAQPKKVKFVGDLLNFVILIFRSCSAL